MNVLKAVVVITGVISLLASCGYVDRKIGALTGYSRMCVDNVEYLQFTSGASVAYTQDGKIKLCKS